VIEIGFAVAFLGGVLTLISPCGALLLPSFFAYAFASPGALFGRTTVFYAGLATSLVPLGMGATFAGTLFFGHRDLLIVVAGWVVIALGVAQILGGGFALRAARRLQGRFAGRTGHGAVFGLGAVYGLAGFCSGPILGAVLTVAASDGRPLHGGALLAVYALGMAGPLFLLALGWERFDLGRRRWLRGRQLAVGGRHLHTTSLLSGVLFVGVGVLFLTTGGTAAGVPGLPSSLEFEATLQAALMRLDGTFADVVVVLILAAVAATVLVLRTRRRRTSRWGSAGAEVGERVGLTGPTLLRTEVPPQPEVGEDAHTEDGGRHPLAVEGQQHRGDERHADEDGAEGVQGVHGSSRRRPVRTSEGTRVRVEVRRRAR
jgi:cytochrome c biogenesis protein CcdA